MSSASLAKIAAQLGVTTTQLKAAMDATKPAKPAAGTDRRTGMATELATALGVDVAQIRTILDANRPARPARGQPGGGRPARGARPSNTKLVAALASGLNLDTASVKAAFDRIEAAHQAEHATRDAAMYSALAAELGVSTDAVKAAFEANRPARPAAAA
jgi:protein-disulfide isomerase-like protein with CxxC motif